MKILIIYSSTDGHTKKICEVIKENLINKGELHLTSIENVSETNVQFYDYIIIGASIRYGKHNRKVFDFIEKNLNIIENKKNAFFSVNVVARKNEKKHTKKKSIYKKIFISPEAISFITECIEHSKKLNFQINPEDENRYYTYPNLKEILMFRLGL